MPSTHSSAAFHYLCGRFPGRLGWLVGPTARTKSKLRPWVPFALDNDAFAAWRDKKPWDECAWLELLRFVAGTGLAPLWCLVPDVVCDPAETLARWQLYAPVAASFGWPLAFATQDGMQPQDVPGDASVVFVGGSLAWKWSTLPTWTARFKRVHVGRVNGLTRLRECEALGVESVDGTGWFRDGLNGRADRDLSKWLPPL